MRFVIATRAKHAEAISTRKRMTPWGRDCFVALRAPRNDCVNFERSLA
jgi:hypothetical protein